MASIVSSKKQSPSTDINNNPDEKEETETLVNPVTCQLFLKNNNKTSKPLDKDVVLRRIRHRRRVNKFQNALQAILRPPYSPTADEDQANWLEDAFSAP